MITVERIKEEFYDEARQQANRLSYTMVNNLRLETPRLEKGETVSINFKTITEKLLKSDKEFIRKASEVIVGYIVTEYEALGWKVKVIYLSPGAGEKVAVLQFQYDMSKETENIDISE